MYEEIDRIGFGSYCRSRTRLGDLSCDLCTALACNDESLLKAGWNEFVYAEQQSFHRIGPREKGEAGGGDER